MNSGLEWVLKGKDVIIMHDLQVEKSTLKKIFSAHFFYCYKNPVFNLANIYWYVPCAKYYAQFCKDTKMNMIEFII